MKLILIILLGSQSFAFTFASYPFFGSCPNLQVVQDFNITKYAGVWYETEKYFSMSDATASCTTLKYRSTGVNGSESEEMSFFKKLLYKRTGKTDSKVGKAVLSGTKKGRSNQIDGRLITSIQSRANKGSYGSKESYWILGTDYDNYSVVWSCENSGVINFQNVRVLTRKRNPPNYVRGLAHGVMKSQRLSTKILITTDQEECPNLFQRKSSAKTSRKVINGKVLFG